MKKFDEFSIEEMEEYPSEKLRTLLDAMRQGINSPERVVEFLKKLEFSRIQTGKERSADYIFKSPDGTRYISFKTGYVRSNRESELTWRGSQRGSSITTRTPIIKNKFSDPIDRLLVILRIAMKQKGLWSLWEKEKLPMEDFFREYRGAISSDKYGL